MLLDIWESGRDRENHADNHVEDNEKFMKFAMSDDVTHVVADEHEATNRSKTHQVGPKLF